MSLSMLCIAGMWVARSHSVDANIFMFGWLSLKRTKQQCSQEFQKQMNLRYLNIFFGSSASTAKDRSKQDLPYPSKTGTGMICQNRGFPVFFPVTFSVIGIRTPLITNLYACRTPQRLDASYTGTFDMSCTNGLCFGENSGRLRKLVGGGRIGCWGSLESRGRQKV